MRSLVPLAVLAAAAIGCAPSSVYDGLSGGERRVQDAAPTITDEVKQDASLAPPRPVAPISVSVIPSSRPRLRWKNVDGASGVLAELSTSRAFAAASTKTFVLDGESAELPEDLTPGFWFWRLRSRAPGRSGTTPSVVWEMYVRGPMKKGSSPIPLGTVLDQDGDGFPELLAVGDVPTDPTDATKAAVQALVYSGVNGSFDVPWQAGSYDRTPLAGPVYFAAPIDVDGDGYPDVAHSGLVAFAPGDDGTGPPPANAGPLGWYSDVETGGDPSADSAGPGGYVLNVFGGAAGTASVASAGDVDGDGYGDLFYMEAHSGFVARGSRQGPRALLPVFRADTDVVPLLGGFDANADGFADLVYQSPAADAKKLALFRSGGADLELGAPATLGPQLDPGYEIRAFTTGDFDGDGIADLAIAARKPDAVGVLCAFYGDKSGTMRAGPCVPGERGDVDWGLSLAAVDIDGAGRDVVLVGVKEAGNVRVDGVYLDDTSNYALGLARGAGSVVLTILPGSKGHPGRWAATTGALDGIWVHDGFDRTQVVPPPYGARAFGRALL